MKTFLVTVFSIALIATSCKPTHNAGTENDGEVSSVAVGESASWPLQRKMLAISNNAKKVGFACTTGAAAAALSLVAETLPILSAAVKLADEESIRKINARYSDAGNSILAIPMGGAVAAVLDVVGNVINATKAGTIKDYQTPRWSESWDGLNTAYASSYLTIQRLLVGENAVCRDSLSSINNVIVSMFPKKK